jgi:hypothetical protein
VIAGIPGIGKMIFGYVLMKSLLDKPDRPSLISYQIKGFTTFEYWSVKKQLYSLGEILGMTIYPGGSSRRFLAMA